MSDSARLPASPSLEQLQKQAKELLRQYRANNVAAIERFRNSGRSRQIALADAQFVLAREYGFESWAKLRHHVAVSQASGLAPFERLARDLAAAYSVGNKEAIREINWNLGTAFVWRQKPERTLTPEAALADARQM